MPEVVLADLYKKFGNLTAVDHIHLTVKDGQVLTDLGPSGGGKTTTLRLIAGFLRPDGGEIRVGDRTASSAQTRTCLTPDRRKMAMVFQSYALWPHMNVLENVMFGLKARKVLPERQGKRRSNRSTW